MWIASLLSVIVYSIICFEQGLYGQILLQAYYGAVAFIGIRNWFKLGKDSGNIDQKIAYHIPKKVALILSLIWIGATSFLIFLLQKTHSEAPFLDGITTTLNMTASFMLVRRYWEQWLLCVVANVLSFLMFARSEMFITASVYLVFLALSIVGLIKWHRWIQNN